MGISSQGTKRARLMSQVSMEGGANVQHQEHMTVQSSCTQNNMWTRQHAFDLLECRMRWSTTQERVRLNAANATRSLGVQLSFRCNPCPDLFCPLLITRKTTRRSLIVPTVTSSFNWDEVGLRSCSVGDRTFVPSGVGSRHCARSEGEPRAHHIGSTPQRC